MFPLVACPVSSAGCECWGECPGNAWRRLMKSFMKIFYFFFFFSCVSVFFEIHLQDECKHTVFQQFVRVSRCA